MFRKSELYGLNILQSISNFKFGFLIFNPTIKKYNSFLYSVTMSPINSSSYFLLSIRSFYTDVIESSVKKVLYFSISDLYIFFLLLLITCLPAGTS